MKKILFLAGCLVLIIGSIVFFQKKIINHTKVQIPKSNLKLISPKASTLNDPLKISNMRLKEYKGSDIVIEQTLSEGSNYKKYIASYRSDGIKIYSLLTIPSDKKPKNGWPVIIFNHGYIPPEIYQTTERYIAYVDAFARHGYIVFKPDYRGNGQSQGKPEGAYYSPAYTTDDLNAIASIKKFKQANAGNIGVWGHSMGGNITLRDLVIKPKWIKAAVIWAGVVGSYSDLLVWHDPTYHPSDQEQTIRKQTRSSLLKKYGTPSSNPDFWNAIDPTKFENDITAPLQLHHGQEDIEVPILFSQNLYFNLKKVNKNVELYIYPGADHNISQSLDIALQRSINFFDRYLK